MYETSNMKQHNHVLESPVESKPISVALPKVSLLTLTINVIVPFVMTRLLLFVVGITSIYYILPIFKKNQPISPDTRITHFPDMLILMWTHFDSGFYLSIAHDGYPIMHDLHQPTSWGFFPLYPLLIRIFALPFGSSTDAYIIVGIIIANVAGLIAAIYLYKLTIKEFDQTIANRAVFYLLLFPMSFYLSAVYPESLFLALSISCIYYARLRCWWLAGILGGLAALARPGGVLLLIAVGWEFWQYLADTYAPIQVDISTRARFQAGLHAHLKGLWLSLRSWRTWLGFVALLCIPAGLLLFSLYSWWLVGNFTAYSTTQQYGWNHYYSNPLLFLLHKIHHPEAISPYNWDFYPLNVLSTCIFALLLIPIFRRLPKMYGLLTLALLLLPLTTGKLDSITRYDLTLFPVYMYLAWWSSQESETQRMQRHTLLVTGGAMLLSLGMAMFALGIFAIA